MENKHSYLSVTQQRILLNEASIKFAATGEEWAARRRRCRSAPKGIAIKYPGSHRILPESSKARISPLLLFGWPHIGSETIYWMVTNWRHPNRIFVGSPNHRLPKGLDRKSVV